MNATTQLSIDDVPHIELKPLKHQDIEFRQWLHSLPGNTFNTIDFAIFQNLLQLKNLYREYASINELSLAGLASELRNRLLFDEYLRLSENGKDTNFIHDAILAYNLPSSSGDIWEKLTPHLSLPEPSAMQMMMLKEKQRQIEQQTKQVVHELAAEVSRILTEMEAFNHAADSPLILALRYLHPECLGDRNFLHLSIPITKLAPVEFSNPYLIDPTTNQLVLNKENIAFQHLQHLENQHPQLYQAVNDVLIGRALDFHYIKNIKPKLSPSNVPATFQRLNEFGKLCEHHARPSKKTQKTIRSARGRSLISEIWQIITNFLNNFCANSTKKSVKQPPASALAKSMQGGGVLPRSPHHSSDEKRPHTTTSRHCNHPMGRARRVT